MGRSIRSQILHCLDTTTARGRSKYSDRAQGIDTRDRTYSNSRADTLRDRGKNFSDFIMQEYPECRRVRDITSEMVQEYIDIRGAQWSGMTQKEVISELGVIERRVGSVYGSTQGWTEGVETHSSSAGPDRVRDRAMELEDLEALREAMSDSRSAARDGLELGSALGLRSDEVVHVRGRDIDIDNMVVHLEGDYCKGGRARDVSIDPSDIDTMKSLHDRYGDNRICDIKAESFDKALRRELEKLGLSDKYENTTEHAIRKEWADRRYESYGGDLSLTDPRQDPKSLAAWQKVQEELGHGSKFRLELYKTYILAK